jgi:molecular chaperone GrpE
LQSNGEESNQEEETAEQVAREKEEMIHTLQDNVNRLQEQMKYLQADFENYRKRMANERALVEEEIRSRYAMEMISIKEDLERMMSKEAPPDTQNFSMALQLILKRVNAWLESSGVQEIEAVGKTFDPHLHEAVSFIQTKDQPDMSVVTELRKGYLLDGKVVRPSMVEVAKNIGAKGEVSHVNKD